MFDEVMLKALGYVGGIAQYERWLNGPLLESLQGLSAPRLNEIQGQLREIEPDLAARINLSILSQQRIIPPLTNEEYDLLADMLEFERPIPLIPLTQEEVAYWNRQMERDGWVPSGGPHLMEGGQIRQISKDQISPEATAKLFVLLKITLGYNSYVANVRKQEGFSGSN
ncbi:hypothetical protein HYU14_03380 [Candidatus Woesearchaeota archaeon]|nr:hypothetical protein [Candidatus Woesearchaeota archaeon]